MENRRWLVPREVLQRAYAEAEREVQRERDARAREQGFEDYAALQREIEKHRVRDLSKIIITT